MTGHSRDPKDHYPMSFYNVIEAEDHPIIDRTFERLTVEKKAAHFEFRLTKRWINTIGSKSIEEPTWLLGLAVPQLNEDGSVKSIMGVQADISKLKWAESLQKRSRIEAEEGTASSCACKQVLTKINSEKVPGEVHGHHIVRFPFEHTPL